MKTISLTDERDRRFYKRMLEQRRERDRRMCRRMLEEMAHAIGARTDTAHFERCVDMVHEAGRRSDEIIVEFTAYCEELNRELASKRAPWEPSSLISGPTSASSNAVRKDLVCSASDVIDQLFDQISDLRAELARVQAETAHRNGGGFWGHKSDQKVVPEMAPVFSAPKAIRKWAPNSAIRFARVKFKRAAKS
jgi:hypothetical protein